MRYMLDTNICIYIAKQNPPKVSARFARLALGDVGMSVVTYGELRFGAEKSTRSQAALRSLEEFIEAVPVLTFDKESAANYGRLRFDLERRGQPIGNNDLWIASHCLHLGLTLVTNNEREFSRIPNLPIENWTH
jgi:tRNA(fMet)-specific endonuclease VapC